MFFFRLMSLRRKKLWPNETFHIRWMRKFYMPHLVFGKTICRKNVVVKTLDINLLKLSVEKLTLRLKRQFASILNRETIIKRLCTIL